MSRGFHSENAQGINSDVFKWEKNMYMLCMTQGMTQQAPRTILEHK